MKNLHAVWVGLVVLAFGSQALADTCQAPKVKVVNDRTDTIKVTKVQYLDGCDNVWRTEDVASTEILSGSSATFTDNLEYVGNCKIAKFKIYRAIRQSAGAAYGSFAWGAELTPDQGSTQLCNTGVTYTIHAFQN